MYTYIPQNILTQAESQEADSSGKSQQQNYPIYRHFMNTKFVITGYAFEVCSVVIVHAVLKASIYF